MSLVSPDLEASSSLEPPAPTQANFRHCFACRMSRKVGPGVAREAPPGVRLVEPGIPFVRLSLTIRSQAHEERTLRRRRSFGLPSSCPRAPSISQLAAEHSIFSSPSLACHLLTSFVPRLSTSCYPASVDESSQLPLRLQRAGTDLHSTFADSRAEEVAWQ